jgi:hypothetical protein
MISVIFASTLLLFASCTTPSVKTDTSAPADSGDIASATSGQNTAEESDAPISAEPSSAPSDSGLTLESLKKAAQAAGYEAEDTQDFQMLDEPKPIDSFNLIYEDDTTQAHIPVYEFKNSADALAFAALVNEEGYNLCIVNGKFLTTTSSQYGVITNDKQTGVLETLLQSKVMTYQEPAWVPLEPAKDYAGAYLHIDAIYKALDKLVNKSVLLYDKAAAEDARISSSGVWFSLISSGDLSFTSSLSEDQAYLDAVVQLWEMFGVTDMKLKHDKAHDYVLTGKRAGLDTTFELHCSYSPSTGALRLLDTDGGEVIEFYEYVPLGGDTYAFQTLYSRAIVEFKDGKILSFIYSLNEQGVTPAYTAKADGIYENSAGVDEAWVSKAGADSYDQFITYDGTTIAIAAHNFMGDRLNVEIEAQ